MAQLQNFLNSKKQMWAFQLETQESPVSKVKNLKFGVFIDKKTENVRPGIVHMQGS